PAELAWPVPWATQSYAAERRGQRAVFRAAALAAIALTVSYLVWRLHATLHGATAWLAACLLVLELHALLSLALHTFDLWNLDAAPHVDRRVPPPLTVAVLIPTYNEPREVLLPTIAAAVALRPAHDTWVLDDGDRPWVAELASSLGARYRARERHDHAKAGNLNDVLPELDVDLVAIFDADHIAHADFLAHTMPYFADPLVAVVQTPQEFYNADSFEHVRTRGGRHFGEQQLFYRALAAGRNRWGAAFWCGTNAVVRLSALRQVGGVSTDSITEDIHTTIRLHRRGWRTVYHNEALASGLAAANIQQYLGQRLRWGVGAMQVLRTENPATVSGLRLTQRISYLSTLLGWFDSWRALGYLLLPLATVATGGLPVAAAPAVFLPWFLAVFLTQRLALRLLARGHATVWHAVLFELIRLPANLRATLALFGPRSRSFNVTAKGRGGRSRTRMPAPRLLVGLLVAHVAGLGWYAATIAGLSPLHYSVTWAAHGAAAWMVANMVVLCVAIHRIRSPRYGVERRAAVRFAMHGPAVLGDHHPVHVHDVSLTGAALSAPAGVAAVGQRTTLTLTADGVELRLPATVRSVSAPAGGQHVHVGAEFDQASNRLIAQLALALFRTDITPTVGFDAPGAAA
ncbi:MAG TPA: glycosyltransferase, partial [Pseudonocardiaceae bacterium]